VRGYPPTGVNRYRAAFVVSCPPRVRGWTEFGVAAVLSGDAFSACTGMDPIRLHKLVFSACVGMDPFLVFTRMFPRPLD
jgi:hypothetical protein